MFHVLNDHSGKFMAEENTFENARIKAEFLANEYQQNYAIYELIHRVTVQPTPFLPDKDGPQ